MQPNPGGALRDERGAIGDPLAGTPYRALGMLGEGGMGEVFEAEHRALGHRVVVKVLRTQLSERRDLHDRMRVEGQALARIRHPHLVMVTDFGQTRSERPYVVMERLAGRSLREELAARSALPVAEASEIARQMLLGLSAAHAAGLVHRDIKPDNVFLCATGDGRPFVKLLDFGVVKIVQAGSDPRTPTPLEVSTGEGVSLGTPRYFSPEQGRGARDLDARSDLYAVGLVLYAMVVGRGPFDHYTTVTELFRAQELEVPLPPSASRSGLPSGFDRVVMKALAKPREERFADAMSFAEELSRVRATLGAEGAQVGEALPALVSAPTGRGFAEATTAVGVVVGVGAGTSGSRSEEPTKTAIAVGAGGRGDREAHEGAGAGELRAMGRRLSDEPVVFDGMVERALSNPPEHVVRERLSRSGKIDRTVIDGVPAARAVTTEPAATVKMEAAAQPYGQGAQPYGQGAQPYGQGAQPYGQGAQPSATEPSRPVAGDVARSSVPETVPMMELGALGNSRPAVSGPLQRRSSRASAWRAPLTIGAVVLVVVALVLALVVLRQ